MLEARAAAAPKERRIILLVGENHFEDTSCIVQRQALDFLVSQGFTICAVEASTETYPSTVASVRRIERLLKNHQEECGKFRQWCRQNHKPPITLPDIIMDYPEEALIKLVGKYYKQVKKMEYPYSSLARFVFGFGTIEHDQERAQLFKQLSRQGFVIQGVEAPDASTKYQGNTSETFMTNILDPKELDRRDEIMCQNIRRLVAEHPGHVIYSVGSKHLPSLEKKLSGDLTVVTVNTVKPVEGETDEQRLARIQRHVDEIKAKVLEVMPQKGEEQSLLLEDLPPVVGEFLTLWKSSIDYKAGTAVAKGPEASKLCNKLVKNAKREGLDVTHDKSQCTVTLKKV